MSPGGLAPPAATGDVVLYLISTVLQLECLCKGKQSCREQADKRVLAIDAQVKTMMNVL